MSKDKKQTPQQAFNQFIFDTMMNKLRAVELYEKEVAGYSKQITQHIKDHREYSAKVDPIMDNMTKEIEKLSGILNFKLNDGPIANHSKRIAELEEANAIYLQSIPDIEILKTQVKGLEQNEPFWDANKRIPVLLSRIEALELDTRLQRDENAAAHIQQSDTIMHMKEQIAGLENRLSRSQDMIAEMHKDGFIQVKKPSGRPKKGAVNDR